MTGFLVVNHFLQGKKYDELYNHLKNAAAGLGVDLQIKTNQQMIFEESSPDFVLFWDKDINLAAMLENRGIPVFNSARAIALCDDKAKTYTALLNKVPQPETYVAPLSFFSCDYSDFVDTAAERLGYPLVYKECYGSFGEQVYLCTGRDEIFAHINGKPFLLQKYIECNSTDVRIEVVNGKCVGAMKRQNPNDFRSNITNGGRGTAYTPTQREQELAVKASNALGLDFCGVDILNGSLVCEVNSNAHIINLKNVTGVDTAPVIIESVLSKI